MKNLKQIQEISFFFIKGSVARSDKDPDLNPKRPFTQVGSGSQSGFEMTRRVGSGSGFVSVLTRQEVSGFETFSFGSGKLLFSDLFEKRRKLIWHWHLFLWRKLLVERFQSEVVFGAVVRGLFHLVRSALYSRLYTVTDLKNLSHLWIGSGLMYLHPYGSRSVPMLSVVLSLKLWKLYSLWK